MAGGEHRGRRHRSSKSQRQRRESKSRQSNSSSNSNSNSKSKSKSGERRNVRSFSPTSITSAASSTSSPFPHTNWPPTESTKSKVFQCNPRASAMNLGNCHPLTSMGEVVGRCGIITKKQETQQHEFEHSAHLMQEIMTNYKTGDHIFRWMTSENGIPFAFQQHAIVMEANPKTQTLTIMNMDSILDEEGNDNDDYKIADLDLSILSDDDEEEEWEQRQKAEAIIRKRKQQKEQAKKAQQQQDDNDGDEDPCCKLTEQQIDFQKIKEQWVHVEYSQAWQKRLISRAGTKIALEPDPMHVVMLRIRFLLSPVGQQLLANMQYNDYKRNGECLAVWCKTGQYITFQGCAKMGEAGMHAGSFAMAGGIAAQVATAAVIPVLVPFLAVYDVGQAILSTKELHTAKAEWTERTNLWNQYFVDFFKASVRNR